MMQCIAIDDEPLALDVIENYVRKIPDLELVAQCTSAMEALEVLNKQKIDLLFLDIQMSDITGIQFLKSLKNPPMVIFTTAYENYALESYELDVLDYLLKPFPFDRFLKAVNKAKEFHSLLTREKRSGDELFNFIFVRSEHQLLKIDLEDILYIEGLKDYVKIFTGPKPIFSHQNLKTIEAKLPSGRFLRVHKSYIVPVRKIESIQKNTLRIGGTEIPIGDSYREQLNRIIQDKSY